MNRHKLRQLEEQVKLMILMLQVKLSVLQEEKTQLTMELNCLKFLGHPLGTQSQSEHYLDLPEDSHDPAAVETCSMGSWVQEKGLEHSRW